MGTKKWWTFTKRASLKNYQLEYETTDGFEFGSRKRLIDTTARTICKAIREAAAPDSTSGKETEIFKKIWIE